MVTVGSIPCILGGMGESVAIDYARSDLAVARFDRILVTFVRGPVTLEYLDAAHRSGRALARKNGGGIGSLTLVPAGASIPGEAERERARKHTREADTWVRAGATVVGGRGFVASAMRSALVTITLFTGGPPRRVFSDVETAIAWLAEQIGESEASLQPLLQWSEVAMGDDYQRAIGA